MSNPYGYQSRDMSNPFEQYEVVGGQDLVQHNPVLQSDEVLSGSEEAQYHRPAPLTRYTDNVPGKEPVNFTGERSNWNEDSFYQPYAQNYAAVSTPQQSSSPGYQPMVNEKCAGTQRKKPRYWIWLLVAVALVCVILSAVLGGVFGSRSNDDDDNKQPWLMSRSSDNLEKLPSSFPPSVLDAANAAAKKGKKDPLTYQGTDVYGNPMFSAQANTAPPMADGKQVGSCGPDPWKPTNNLKNGRPGHPRLIAPQHLWDCLPSKIENDAYLTAWNYSIFQNATNWLDADPVKYDVDGGLTLSGILDVARIVQQRLKAWAYAFRMSKDRKYVDRAWKEMQTAAGETKEPFGKDDKRWNPDHFLDTAEFLSAYAFAYDWMYDAWSDDQRKSIIDWIVRFGLAQGLEMYNKNTAWWSTTASGNGNWNCVSNGGLVVAALAIQNDVKDNKKYASIVNQILPKALDNAKKNCMRAVYEDGTWSETPHYWYFGTNGHARMMSSLMSATGSDQGLMDQNKNFFKTGDFHMYVTGVAGMFSYGDNGPNKFSTTANQLFLYGMFSQQPVYSLFQRDRADAASDPLSMFWYDTSVKGGFWNGLPLDKFFNNDQGSWFSMRGSWTDMSRIYVAMKASNNTLHQTHGDLDAGDFVIDALGTRFAGEYGSDNYLSKDYFASESADAARWTYFRKGTQGQNTLVIGNANQNPNCKPENKFETTGIKQNEDLGFSAPKEDAAYVVSDLSSCYNAPSGSVKRGIRMLNGRRQVLVQDEIKKQGKNVEWRVQTNATVTLSDDKRTATMKISKVDNPNAAIGMPKQQLPGEVTMLATILQPSSAKFSVTPAYDSKKNTANYLYGADKVPKQGKDTNNNHIQAEVIDEEVSVLSISLPGDSDQKVEVWWQPQYPELSDDDKAAPKDVPLDKWSLKSH